MTPGHPHPYESLTPDTVLDAYFRLCALRMSCVQLARACSYLCLDGQHPFEDEPVVSNRQARRINALMLTCGCSLR